MLDSQQQPLYKTTIDELAGSVQAWGAYVLSYTVIGTVLRCVSNVPDAASLLKAKTNPVLAAQLMAQGIPFAVASLMLWFVSSYIFSVIYLRHAIPNKPPVLSIRNFFLWLKYCLIRFLRPFLWLMLPIIGWFFYIRSIIRRSVVTPMAILGHPNITQKSWDMTDGKAWYIFKQGLTLNVAMWVAIFLAGLGIGLLTGIISVISGSHGATIVQLVKSAVAALSSGLVMMANAIFACVTYRAVLKEYKMTRQANQSLPT